MIFKNQHKQLVINAKKKKQRWLLFVVIILAILIDVLISGKLVVAKSASLGAVIAYAMQFVFTAVSYRRDERLIGKHRYNALMSDMYLAVIAKWLFAIVCFVLVFVFVKPMHFLAFFVGLIVMQLLIMIALLGTKN